MATSPVDPQRIQGFRRFNRFYTQRIGVLQKGLLGSAFSLAEARVLFELAHRDGPTAAELVRELGLDAGYLSRILRGLERQGLLAREASKDDGRESLLSLTGAGRDAFADLGRRTQEDLRGVLAAIPPLGQARLVEAMRTIEEVLGAPAPARAAVVLRSPEPGDMG